MRRTLWIVIASHLLMNFLYADSGQSGLAFLKLGIGARAVGMGEAYSAVASDPTSIYYNPAAIAGVSYPQLMIMHKSWIQDVRAEYLGASVKWNALALGLSLNTTSVNDIEIRSVPGDPIGTFSAHNAAIGLTGAYEVDSSLHIGITAKYLYEKYLVDEANGLGFDLGANYMSPWGVKFAAGYFNIGSMSILHTEASALPKLVRGGAAYTIPIQPIEGAVTLAADVLSYTVEQSTHLHVGTEIVYHDMFAVRLGYQTGYEGKNISAGVGLHYGVLQFDYAFVPFSYDLGTTHTLSVGIDFRD